MFNIRYLVRSVDFPSLKHTHIRLYVIKFYFLPFSERQNEEDLLWKLTATSTLFTPFKKWRGRRIKDLLAYTSCNSIRVVFVGAKPLTLTARNNRVQERLRLVDSSRGWKRHCSAEKSGHILLQISMLLFAFMRVSFSSDVSLMQRKDHQDGQSNACLRGSRNRSRCALYR